MATESGPTPQAALHAFAGALQSALTLNEVAAAFLSGARRVVTADCIGMYRLGDDAQRVLGIRSDAESAFLDEYERYGRAHDPVLDAVVRQGRPMDSTRAVRREIWEDSGARAALSTVGLEHSMEAPLVASGAFLGTVNFARRAGEPPFSDADLASAYLLAEQVGRATERALRYEQTGIRTTALEGALDMLPMAVIVTDFDAQVLFRNRGARNAGWADAGDLSGRDHHGPVEASIGEAIEQFRQHGKRLHLRSVGDRETRTRRIVRSHRLGETSPAVVTLVFDAGAQTPGAKLPSWDVLSRREQEIVDLVSEGLTNQRIAERAFISENTVKQHLKRVFARTGVRNRAELIQLVWSARSESERPHAAR